jgi:hypothetical protein
MTVLEAFSVQKSLWTLSTWAERKEHLKLDHPQGNDVPGTQVLKRKANQKAHTELAVLWLEKVSS